jgi:hypothetical protein
MRPVLTSSLVAVSMPTSNDSGTAHSPSEVALESFGAGKFASVVRECRSSAWAVVLLATNEEPYVVPYEITLRFDGHSWVETSGNDSPGWRAIGDGQGFVTFWDRASVGASSVTVVRGDTVKTSPVRYGYFLVVFWDVPERQFDPASLPQVIASD